MSYHLIPLKIRKKHFQDFAIISKKDVNSVSKYNWHLHNAGYAITHDYRPKEKVDRFILMHRLIMGENNKYIDHINGNKLDNRRENLRPCTHSQNITNSDLKRRGFASKYRGVSIDRNHKLKPWVAQIKKQGKHYFLGNFKTEIDAAIAYNKKAKELHGAFARLNPAEEAL